MLSKYTRTKKVNINEQNLNDIMLLNVHNQLSGAKYWHTLLSTNATDSLRH